MDKNSAQAILDKVIAEIFGIKNPMSVDQFQQKYAFDIKLPVETVSSISNAPTWASSLNPGKFITYDEQIEQGPFGPDWMQEKRPLNSLEDILAAWNTINYTATEKVLDSENIAESDMIIGSQNIWRSQDIINAKNIILSDSVQESDHIVAGHRSNTSVYCARLEDSKECSASFSVSFSKKIAKSLFVHNSASLFECIFCSHISNKRFCVANMQFEEEEYYKIKQMVVEWIFSS